MTFHFRTLKFVVCLLDGWRPVYRDMEHLGGQWTNAEKAIRNTSLHPTFRKRLRLAVEQLLLDKQIANANPV
jgi:hypothetical protein